jgi:hypothetical protein
VSKNPLKLAIELSLREAQQSDSSGPPDASQTLQNQPDDGASRLTAAPPSVVRIPSKSGTGGVSGRAAAQPSAVLPAAGRTGGSAPTAERKTPAGVPKPPPAGGRQAGGAAEAAGMVIRQSAIAPSAPVKVTAAGEASAAGSAIGGPPKQEEKKTGDSGRVPRLPQSILSCVFSSCFD